MRANLQKYAPKKIVSSISIIVGYALLLPYETTGHAENLKRDYQTQGIDASFQIKNKFGTVAGLAVFHSFGKRWELGARLLYERKGFIEVTEIERPGDYRKYQIDFKNNYLTLSFIPSIAIGKKRNVIISTGFLYNYILQSTSTDTHFVNGSKTQTSKSHYLKSASGKDEFNGNLIVGVGYPIRMTDKVKLSFQLQYNYGIKEIYEWKQPSFQSKVKSNGILLTVEFKWKN